jgi:hypothetical protein
VHKAEVNAVKAAQAAAYPTRKEPADKVEASTAAGVQALWLRRARIEVHADQSVVGQPCPSAVVHAMLPKEVDFAAPEIGRAHWVPNAGGTFTASALAYANEGGRRINRTSFEYDGTTEEACQFAAADQTSVNIILGEHSSVLKYVYVHLVAMRCPGRSVERWGLALLQARLCKNECDTGVPCDIALAWEPRI